MTPDQIKAAILESQEKTRLEPDSMTVDQCKDGSTLVAFVCESYRAKWLTAIEKSYTIEVRYVDAFHHRRALVGLMLTPKPATV